jgi:hypothetical protein
VQVAKGLTQAPLEGQNLHGSDAKAKKEMAKLIDKDGQIMVA